MVLIMYVIFLLFLLPDGITNLNLNLKLQKKNVLGTLSYLTIFCEVCYQFRIICEYFLTLTFISKHETKC